MFSILTTVALAQMFDPDPPRSGFSDWVYVGWGGGLGVEVKGSIVYIRDERVNPALVNPALKAVTVVDGKGSQLAVIVTVDTQAMLGGARSVWAIDTTGSVAPWTVTVNDQTTDKFIGWTVGMHDISRR